MKTAGVACCMKTARGVRGDIPASPGFEPTRSRIFGNPSVADRVSSYNSTFLALVAPVATHRPSGQC